MEGNAMRQSFDLLTAAGWRSWWQHKFNRWGYVNIAHDTLPHFVCLVRGHDVENVRVPIAERVCCGRCNCYLRTETGRRPNV